MFLSRTFGETTQAGSDQIRPDEGDDRIMGFGPWQLVLIFVLVVLVFGSKRLPDTARSLGKSLRILKSETAAMKTDGQATTSASASTAEEPPAPRTLQAAPGDVASSPPVQEPRGTTQS